MADTKLPINTQCDDNGATLKPSAGSFPDKGASIKTGATKAGTTGYTTSKKF